MSSYQCSCPCPVLSWLFEAAIPDFHLLNFNGLSKASTTVHPSFAALPLAGQESVITVHGRCLRRTGVRFFARVQGKDIPLTPMQQHDRPSVQEQPTSSTQRSSGSGSSRVMLRVPAMARPGLIVIEAARMELLGAWQPLLAMDSADEAEELNAWAQTASHQE